MTMRVRDLTQADLEDIAGWRYDDHWAVYDSAGPLDPGLGYWAVVDDVPSGDGTVERLVGFGCLGEDARVPGLAEVDGVPVLCRHGRVLAAAFHPELSDDLRLHQLFLED